MNSPKPEGHYSNRFDIRKSNIDQNELQNINETTLGEVNLFDKSIENVLSNFHVKSNQNDSYISH